MKIVHKIVHKCVHFGMLFVARGLLSRAEWFVLPTDHHGLTRIYALLRSRFPPGWVLAHKSHKIHNSAHAVLVLASGVRT